MCKLQLFSGEGSYTGNAWHTVKILYSDRAPFSSFMCFGGKTGKFFFVTLLSQGSLCCVCKQFGKEHKVLMWDYSLTSASVCLISSQNAVEDVVSEVPEVHHVCGELHLFCMYPFSDRHIMMYCIMAFYTNNCSSQAILNTRLPNSRVWPILLHV